MNRYSVAEINSLLPQTQCRECGFSGCLPYAQALADDKAEINLCLPGGEEVMRDIAHLLNRPIRLPEKQVVQAVAYIDEAVCIGCTACIKACPVDAILGASKYMHTVLADECTGCGLCLPPCPIDCITMEPVQAAYLPQSRSVANPDVLTNERFAASSQALQRYTDKQNRLHKQTQERRRKIAEREAAVKQTDASTQAAAAFNPAALIAQAMERAQTQQNRRATPNNFSAYQAEQVRQAQEKATYRRHVRDAQYGDETQKATAIEWLRQYKAEQDKQQNPS